MKLSLDNWLPRIMDRMYATAPVWRSMLHQPRGTQNLIDLGTASQPLGIELLQWANLNPRHR